MIKAIWENYLFSVIAILTFIFLAGLHFLPATVFFTILNCLFIGVAISQLIVYGQFAAYALLSHTPYTRERQFTVSVALLWMAYVLVVTYSTTHRTINVPDTELPVDWQLLLSRYLVIVASTLQIFSPDMGESLFYGVNRKIVTAGIVLGLAAAGILLLAKLNPATASALDTFYFLG